MIGYLRRLTIRNLVSPYGLALFSYAVFLFAWTFPPSVYTSYINEPDLMFLDPLTFIFYTSCVAAFLFGVYSCRYLGSTTRKVPIGRISTSSPILYLTTPLALAAVCCCVYLSLLGGKVNLFVMLASQQGQVIKDAGKSGLLDVGMGWNKALMSLTCVLWWTSFRAQQLKLKGSVKLTYRAFFIVALCLDIVTCVATVDRTNLMPLIAGLLVLYFYRKTQTLNVRLTSMFGVAATSVGGAIGVFSLISYLRGALAIKFLLASVLGYTATSYNRMTALLSGAMQYMYTGKGAYLLGVFMAETKLNDFLQVREITGWPTYVQLFYSNFASVGQAGLNRQYIWSGAFGYIYADIGWWALLYLFLVGLWAGYIWSGFKRGRAIFVVMYLWMAFCIFFWVGNELTFDTRTANVFAVAVLLALYDRAFMRKMVEDHSGSLSGENHQPDLDRITHFEKVK